MRKQLTKGFAMLLVVVALAFVTAVASANGQSIKVRANVPFDFMVGDKTLPAGGYTVGSITASGDCLSFRALATNDQAVRLTMSASGKADHAKLVFHKYGERYFLAEVWSSEDAGRVLTKSRQERAIEKENTAIARHGGSVHSAEIVEVLASLR